MTVKCIYLLDYSLRPPWQHPVSPVKFFLSHGRSYTNLVKAKEVDFVFFSLLVEMIRNIIRLLNVI